MPQDLDPRLPRRSRAVVLAQRLAIGLPGLIILAWLVGRLVSDRYLWSQFLAWIPTPAALLAGAIVLAAWWRIALSARARRRRCLPAALVLVAMVAYFGLAEHHMFASALRLGPAPGDTAGHAPAAGALHITHWTMSHHKRPLDEHSRLIAAHIADLTILTDAYGIPLQNLASILPADAVIPPRVGCFKIISRLPVIEARSIIARDGINVAVLRVDATARIGRELTVCLVDLPSDLAIGRAEQARRLRISLSDAGLQPPDLVVGDFNTPRGSRSLSLMFPGMHHAYDDAGAGYSASFHRALPLYHIDHMLLSDEWRASTYRLVDPGLGRHRLQEAAITAR
jgi:hypothetical protein